MTVKKILKDEKEKLVKDVKEKRISLRDLELSKLKDSELMIELQERNCVTDRCRQSVVTMDSFVQEIASFSEEFDIAREFKDRRCTILKAKNEIDEKEKKVNQNRIRNRNSVAAIEEFRIRSNTQLKQEKEKLEAEGIIIVKSKSAVKKNELTENNIIPEEVEEKVLEEFDKDEIKTRKRRSTHAKMLQNNVKGLLNTKEDEIEYANFDEDENKNIYKDNNHTDLITNNTSLVVKDDTDKNTHNNNEEIADQPGSYRIRSDTLSNKNEKIIDLKSDVDIDLENPSTRERRPTISNKGKTFANVEPELTDTNTSEVNEDREIDEYQNKRIRRNTYAKGKTDEKVENEMELDENQGKSRVRRNTQSKPIPKKESKLGKLEIIPEDNQERLRKDTKDEDPRNHSKFSNFYNLFLIIQK